MGSINTKNGKLFLDFRYKGVRCREYTKLIDNAPNRKRLNTLMEMIQAEITLNNFDYGRYFPNSKRAEKFKKIKFTIAHSKSAFPLFNLFAKQWYKEKEAEWRNSYVKNMHQTLGRYLLPAFGHKPVNEITKTEILAFRSSLTKPDNLRKKPLSASRINHVMTPLRMILNEAADRYEFSSPWRNIKPLRVPRTDIEPFSLPEIQKILESVRPDFYNYYCVRFFAGLRTAEIDGLKWEFIDFQYRKILIRQTLVNGITENPKNDGSFRDVDMAKQVYDALKLQRQKTGDKTYVFCNKSGKPFSHNVVTKNVWYPLLRHLGLKKRRPYQTRHTAATLWLSAGESPEWIARQMGHASTEMLFKVYSRFVPNLTRHDGSAFEKLISEQFKSKTNCTSSKRSNF